MKILIVYLVIINLIGFYFMYSDKKKAINNKYRIAEKRLFLVGFLGGSLGLLMGMYKFHHKTKHSKFIYGVPVLLIMNFIIIFIMVRTFT